MDHLLLTHFVRAIAGTGGQHARQPQRQPPHGAPAGKRRRWGGCFAAVRCRCCLGWCHVVP
ncbi:hypothetical protein SXCC_01650 [Gluconacetobacter sp. SXCC-1]|nr:hypothetical protein SXCC_01650 [Gluconacetobacter sp. SXCC-1]